VNPHLYKGQAETVNALTPVSGLATTALALVINPKIPASDIRGLIEYAKANPGKINFGVPGIGSISHLATEQFQAQAGVKLNSVSYRGAAPAISDLIAGHIDAMFIAVGLVRGPAGAGKLKLLGIGSASRLEKMADLPTISETLPGFESTIWFGLFAPKGTPSEIVDKLNNVVQRIVSNPEFNAKYMAPNLFVPIPGKPSALSQTIEQQSARWKKVIGSSGIKVSQ
jgi:tripartite-type tricarboxylate transporter receptor subunit TctC